MHPPEQRLPVVKNLHKVDPFEVIPHLDARMRNCAIFFEDISENTFEYSLKFCFHYLTVLDFLVYWNYSMLHWCVCVWRVCVRACALFYGGTLLHLVQSMHFVGS